MEARARQELCELIRLHGRELADEPRRLDAFLRDACSGLDAEIHVLVSAAKQQVPSELLAQPSGITAQALSARLEKKYALASEAARWAVESWAQALQLSWPRASSEAPSSSQSKPGGARVPPELTPSAFFEAVLPERLQVEAGRIGKVGAAVAFQIQGSGGGLWMVDCTSGGGGKIVSGSSAGAKATIVCSDVDFVNILTGKTNAQMAFMSGKLKVKGDMGLALKLQHLLK